MYAPEVAGFRIYHFALWRPASIRKVSDHNHIAATLADEDPLVPWLLLASFAQLSLYERTNPTSKHLFQFPNSCRPILVGACSSAPQQLISSSSTRNPGMQPEAAS